MTDASAGTAKRLARAVLRPLWGSRTLGLWAERYFWWRWVRSRGLEWPDEFERRLDPAAPLLPHIARYAREAAGEPVRILDVGAGAVTNLGYRLEGRRVEITAVDVLAAEYERLWDSSGRRPPVRTQYADAERLGERFEPASFDIVHAQNSLDHAARPALAIDEMVRLAKPGGYVLLNHAQNEALNEGYTGLHQWNFFERAGRFVIWNAAQSIDVSERLGSGCDVRTESTAAGAVFVEIRKR